MRNGRKQWPTDIKATCHHYLSSYNLLRTPTDELDQREARSESPAGNADRPVGGCHAGYLRSAQCAACRCLCPVHENQKLSLAYVRPAFPRLSSLVGRAERADFRR